MDTLNWGKKFEEAGALWRMNYDNLRGAHAELTSDKHSDGYCNCAKIVENPALVAAVAQALIEKLTPSFEGTPPDYVVGPAYGAITFAHEVAKQLGTKFAFTEIEYVDGKKTQVLKRFDIKAGQTALIIEDVKTTGGSAQSTISVLAEKGVTILPEVGLLLNWSGEATLGNYKAVALVDAKMNVWEPADCPLCKQGSKAVRPKGSWDTLAR
jgi:orotate phosphoribosyltransferase